MEPYAIDTIGLAGLLKDQSLQLIDCCKQEETSVQSIPGAKFFTFSWNRDKLAEELSGLCLNMENQVVLFDSTGVELAARLWWILKTIGVTRVKVLDGGLEKWVEEYGSVCEVDIVPPSSNSPINIDPLRNAIITRSELIELDCDTFTLIPTDSIPKLREKLLSSNLTFQPLSVVKKTLTELNIMFDSKKQIIVGGEYTGTLLILLDALGYKNCKVLSDEGTQLITKRTTVFYDIDEEHEEDEESKANITVKQPVITPSAQDNSYDEFDTRNTRFFTALPVGEQPLIICETATLNKSAAKANAKFEQAVETFVPPTPDGHYRKPPPAFKGAPPKKSREDVRQTQCSGCFVF